MSLAKRISEHPWLSLTVSAATIVSTVLAVFVVLGPGAPSQPMTDTAVPGQGSQLVGIWTLQTPPDLGWRVEYRSNGTFTLTTTDGLIDGFFEAENGVFTTRAPSTGSEDHGTYRLLDTGTLEMSGQLGVSTWHRVAE